MTVYNTKSLIRVVTNKTANFVREGHSFHSSPIILNLFCQFSSEFFFFPFHVPISARGMSQAH